MCYGELGDGHAGGSSGLAVANPICPPSQSPGELTSSSPQAQVLARQQRKVARSPGLSVAGLGPSPSALKTVRTLPCRTLAHLCTLAPERWPGPGLDSSLGEFLVLTLSRLCLEPE